MGIKKVVNEWQSKVCAVLCSNAGPRVESRCQMSFNSLFYYVTSRYTSHKHYTWSMVGNNEYIRIVTASYLIVKLVIR